MVEKTGKSPIKQAAMQIVAGGSAGFVEVCTMHPLDVVKTRLQIQAKPVFGNTGQNVINNVYYNGVFDCFVKIYKNEGILSWWKGILPPILVETPKRACKFVTFEQSKRFYLFGAESPTPLTFSLAGLTAGSLEAIIVNPFEVVKIALQVNKSIGKEVPSTWHVTREIIKKDGIGLRGLNKALPITIARNGTWNMIYFGFYHTVKDLIPEYQNSTSEIMRKMGIGFVSSVLACVSIIPMDVAKTRIQGPQPIPGKIKYRTIYQTLPIIYKEEGFAAFYKGLLPIVMRLGPGGAIMLVLFEYTFNYLDQRFG